MSQSQDNTRPDPDQLLAQVNHDASSRIRGKLKIFFGMSAGVGKTYAMLEEARKRAAEGLDVLVGYAEPHIRPDTEAVLVALDILPYKLVDYRGTTLKEFDLDAAIAHKPAVCCVDELAHTNAPGLRHPKRWQDVDELLDAGINVYTTLNVQHLESVNDLVERITGVRVRETLPDAIFDAADEVELVDIAPEELLERFREGRIYRPDQANRASRHFFTTGNLIALRELALRKTAERVDEQMQEHLRNHQLRQVVPASEKVLVCVGPSPLSARIIRSARRLSYGLRAKLIAVSVEPEAGVAGSTQMISANLKLAEDLGAHVVTLTGKSIATEVLAYARANNVTKIVIGKPDQSRWKDMILGSIVDEIIRHSGEIDIYVIRGEKSEPRTPSSTGPAKKLPMNWIGSLWAVGVVALTTAIGWPLHHRLHIENENVLMLYLLGVLWIATRQDRTSAILASILSVAAFDYMFVEPYYKFAISDRQYIVTFLVMLLTALVISALTHRVKAQAEGARQRERRTAALLGLSRDLAASQTLDQIAQATQQHASQAISSPTVLLIADNNRKLSIAQTPDGVQLDARELGAAQWAMDHAQPAGHGTTTLPAAIGTYVPLHGQRGVTGVLGIFGPVDASHVADRRQIIEAFAAQAALAVERASLADEARTAWERVESEFLRNTLLSGVSHELRTPLAGITGAATALAESGDAISPAARAEMLDTLIEEASRMERLINNLLDMTRMESGGLSLRREWTPLQEIVGATLHHMDRRLVGRQVDVQLPADLPLVHLDETAIEQVLSNLLDNAVEYSPANSPLELSARRSGESVVIEVCDHGPGIPPGIEKRIFDKFFRARPSAGTPNRGIGLGLAISRGIVEAHGGAIHAANRPEGGACVTIMLPIGGTPPVVDSSR